VKKKVLLALCLAAMVCALSACSSFSVSGMDAMFRDTTGNRQLQTGTEPAASETKSAPEGDTVTISREEYERYKQFDDVLQLMDAAQLYFYQDVDKNKMLEGAAAGALKGLDDPYTFYYNPEQWEKMWEDDKGEYAGIGVMITADYSTGLCTITRVFRGSPAEEVGVRRGDILYKVNGELTVTAENLQDAVDIMRGTPGTTVDVTFIRDSDELTLTINRANVVVNQIESTLLDDEIGYIAMYQFAGECEKEFEQAFNELKSRGMKGLIFDLRDNPGGWVDAAQYIADLFLDAGDLCTLVYRDGSEEHPYPLKDGKTELPMVILVNENTASSSEILTAALSERAGATVVGVKTYGKGIVQSVMPVGNEGAGFQITIAQYHTPDGNALHKVGISPDVEIPLEKGDNGSYQFADVEKDTQLKKALETLEKKMD